VICLRQHGTSILLCTIFRAPRGKWYTKGEKVPLCRRLKIADCVSPVIEKRERSPRYAAGAIDSQPGTALPFIILMRNGRSTAMPVDLPLAELRAAIALFF
jgi:hypothetical protein